MTQTSTQYVGFEAAGQHIGLVPGGGPQGMVSPVALLVHGAQTRDVPVMDGEVEGLEIDALPQQRGERFVARTGFDPRAPATLYHWFRTSPHRIQAWREVSELPDRELMREGSWLVSDLGRARRGPAQQMETR
jgi:hypothetical protein